MKQAEIGDTVRVHYTGTFPDGTQFDTSADRGPLEVTLGSREVIPGFEEAIVGMAEGESKAVTVEPDAAYGMPDPQLVSTVERERIPPEIELQVGLELQATNSTGQPVRLTVVDLSDDSVTLDANHPLAGVPLTFELELVEFVA
jgi:peptidylprolyl isomerase